MICGGKERVHLELRLGNRSISYFEKAYDAVFSREETAESVVPDVMPDIGEILSAEGIVLLRSKEAEQGRVTLTGNIETSVLYLPDGESGIKKLYLSIPFSTSAESTLFFETTRVVAALKLLSIEARMLNPRKVLVKACVCVDLKCYGKSEALICDGVEDGNEEVLTKTAQCVLNPVMGVREKTFVLSDEYAIPQSNPEFGEVLGERVNFVIEDMKTVGDKLIFKGAAQVVLLYLSADESEVEALAYTTPFSQIIEMDGTYEYEQLDAEVCLTLTGAYFEPLPLTSEGRVISAEIHAVAQVTCAEKTELTYLADAYSNSCDIEIYRETIEMECVERRMTARERRALHIRHDFDAAGQRERRDVSCGHIRYVP